MLADLERAGLLYEMDGARWFRATACGLERDRVVVKSSGEATYLLPDLAYHRQKFARGFDLVIDVQGADHKEQFPYVVAGAGALGCPVDRLELIMHQFVTLTRGGEQVKQSTRRATYVTVDELIEEVGNDVFRFFMVQRRAESHLDFDVDLAKNTDWKKNPAYYVQYAHARTHAIERKARELGVAAAGRRERRRRPARAARGDRDPEEDLRVSRGGAARGRHARAAPPLLLRARAGRLVEPLSTGRRAPPRALRRSRADERPAGPRARGADRARRRTATIGHLGPGANVMNTDRRSAGWVSTLVALVVLVVVGFLCGALAGFLWEEPGLVLAYLSGKTEPVEWTDAEHPADVAAEPPVLLGERGARGGHGAEARRGRPPARAGARAGARGGAGRAAARPRPAPAKPVEKKPVAPAPARAAKPAPPKPAPAKVAAVTPAGRFSVQVGAFADRASADKLASRLRAHGYDTFVKADSEAGGKRFRVRVGPVNARARAEELAAKLAKGEKLPTWILDESKG